MATKKDFEQYGLGRKPQFDKRSKEFPIRALLTREQLRTPRSYTWRCEKTLDQGPDGACVGFGYTHELIARPKAIKKLDYEAAMSIYHTAQTLDPWPGENYSGTSMLAGIKAVQQLYPTLITEYRWCFDFKDLVVTLGYKGPVVMGINWYTGMFTPDRKTGILSVTGSKAGGHCILAMGVDVKKKLIKIHNSWGPKWGINGEAYFTFADMKRIMAERAEFCVPVRRGKLPK